MRFDLKAFAVVHWGRGGTAYLGGLFDGHPQVLGMVNQSLNHFYAYFSHSDLSSFGDFEGVLDCLQRAVHPVPLIVEGKIVPFLVSECLDVLRDWSLHYDLMVRRNLLMALHYACNVIHGNTNHEVTHFLFHLHLMSHKGTSAFLQDFPDAKFVGVKRDDPLKALDSLCKLRIFDNEQLLNPQTLRLNPLHNYHNAYEFVAQGAYLFRYTHGFWGWRLMAHALGQKVYEVSLDALNADLEQVMRALVDYLGLPYQDTLLISTHFGRLHEGDLWSPVSPVLESCEQPDRPWRYFSAFDELVFRQVIARLHEDYRHYGDSAYDKLLPSMINCPTALEQKALSLCNTSDEVAKVIAIKRQRIGTLVNWLGFDG